MNSKHKNILVGTTLTIGLLLVTFTAVAVPPPAGLDTDPILDAIRKVETGGCADPSNAVGDGGQAIGPFQIHKVYWQDAVQYDPSIGGKYEDCRNEEYARRIVIAYCSRYAPDWNAQTISRIHNGGPKGHKKTATLKYWFKIQKILDQK